jgi:hypothetical protein
MRARRFLVVGDDVASAISLTLGFLGPMTQVNRVDVASRALVQDGRSYTGLFVDRTLPDGSGFAVVERALALGLEIPAIVAIPRAGAYEERRKDLNHAYDLGASCLPMPVSGPNIALSVRRADQAAADDEAEDERFIEQYAEETGLSIEYVKTLVLEILEKTGGRTLAENLRGLRREAAALETRRRRRKKRVSRTLH